MASEKTVPSSAKTFLESGTEAVQCSICKEPFTSKHVAIQIKGCGHQFGKKCLEKWLQQKASAGTCPLCRDVLFEAFWTPEDDDWTEPVSPTRFCEYYKQDAHVHVSVQDGFLSKLWTHLSRVPSDSPRSTPAVAISQTYDNLSGPERRFLRPYVFRIDLLGHDRMLDDCPVTSLAHSLDRLSCCCQSDFKPSLATWHAILLYHTHAANKILHWGDIRDAAWSLQLLRIEGRDTGEHWRSLHLFFFFLAIHRSQQCPHFLPYKIKQVRGLIRMLDCGDASAELSRQDTATKLFLSAASHVLVLSKIDDGPGQDARCARLHSETTEVAQLKQDVEQLWLEAMALGANEIAAGFPDSWWYHD